MAGEAERLSAFNFCDPFDHILPGPDGTVSELDRQHLWGLYTGIAASESVVAPTVDTFDFIAYINQSSTGTAFINQSTANNAHVTQTKDFG